MVSLGDSDPDGNRTGTNVMKKNYCIGLIQAIAVVCLCGALYAEDGKSEASSGEGASETFSIDPVHSTAADNDLASVAEIIA